MNWFLVFWCMQMRDIVMVYSQERDEIHEKNDFVSWFLVHANEGYSQGASGILGLIAAEDEGDLHYLTRMALLSVRV